MKNAPDLAGAPVYPNFHRSVRASKVWVVNFRMIGRKFPESSLNKENSPDYIDYVNLGLYLQIYT